MKKAFIKTITGVLIATTVMSAMMITSNASEVPEQMDTAATEVTQADTTQGYRFSTPEILNEIAAMEIADPGVREHRNIAVEHERECPMWGVIKRYLQQKGANLAFILAIYYIPSPTMYDAIKIMEYEIDSGNRGYVFNGQYFESPDVDPTFYDSL